MIRVLAFGGTGLIGAETVLGLASRGCDVATFGRSNTKVAGASAVIQGDIADADAVARAVSDWQPDAILLLAARLQVECDRAPALAVAANVVGVTNVLEAAARERVRRVVFGSSIATYGQRDDLMHEDDAPSPSISLYGEMKRFAEMLGIRYSALHGLEFAALRYSGVFGPRGAGGAGMSLARHLLVQTCDGRDVTLDFVSGNETVHLTYVADAANATVRALTNRSLSHHVYNVGGPSENYMSLCEFHAKVRSLVPGAGHAVFTGAALSAGPLDTGRMRLSLSYEPQYSVEEALRLTIDSIAQMATACDNNRPR